MSFGSKDWANEQLRFGIEVLREKHPQPNVTMQLVLHILQKLESRGFVWQVKILNSHIHHYQASMKKDVVGLRRVQR